MEELKKLEKLINKARSLELKTREIINNIYDMLDDMKIDLSIESEAENAETLEETISCYIDYGEYSVKEIIKEIKNQMR